MNNPISFETAKLLKEKGFDVPVRNYYLQKEKGDHLHEGFEDEYWGDNKVVNWNKDIIGIKPFQGFISAPTIAEVVMWLYEKHGIWIFAFSYSRRWQWKIDSDSSTAEYSRGDGFNSPTEAYEAAIEYTLKNLIK